MHCPFCETPILKCPGFSLYCPNTECERYPEGMPEEMLTYEVMRRVRDGLCYAGMPRADWKLMFEACQEDCA